MPTALRPLLESLHAAAVAGAQPGPAVAAALQDVPLPGPDGGVHLLAVGKGAHAMAAAAVAALAARGVTPAGGLVVAHHPAPAPAPELAVVVGDHPVPGAGSRRAADALGDAAALVRPTDLAVVLLSGGASSLVAQALPPLAADDVAELSRVLLGAGVPIDVTNAARKRVTRWGAGRLAAALAPARTLCLAVSDVPGDDPAVIGSGPCTGDPWTAAALRAALDARGVLAPLPPAVRAYLHDDRPERETPKPGDPRLAHVAVRVIRTNADACRAAAHAARARGLHAQLVGPPLAGEARACATELVAALRASPPGTCLVWGGEPVVTLAGAPPDARGGRMQELALAAAALLDGRDDVALLAAGTDGRDGPTDAAGAVVDGRTWQAIRAAGRDPSTDLAAHRAHDALDAAGALLRTGPTGTNVADVVVAVCKP